MDSFPHAAVTDREASGRAGRALSATPVLAAVVGLALALRLGASLTLGAHGVSRFIDDAYYYLIIARNFARTGFATFDGVNATNGFHPLWMLMLAAMYRLIGSTADLFTQILAAKALEGLVLALALAACLAAFHRLRGKTPAAWGFLGAALVLLLPRIMLFEQGMESTLAAGLLMAALYAWLDRRPRWLAASLALLFLARLDTLVFVIAPLALAWGMRERENGRLAWMPFLPVAIVAIVYMGVNFAATGHPTPISGQIKSSFPIPTPHFSFLFEPLEVAPLAGWKTLYTVANPLAATVALCLLALACAWRSREAWTRPVALALAMAALLLLNILLFQRWDKGAEPRYLALPYVLLGFSAMTIVAGIARSALLPAAIVLVGMAACGAGTVTRFAEEKDQRFDRSKALQVMAMTAPGDRFAGTDIGGFSFWLERAFVNLDGLVNNRELQDAIRDHKLAAYLERMDVRYLLLAFWDRDQAHISRPTDRMYRSRIFPPGVKGPGYGHFDFTLYSYLYDADSDPIRLCASQEIYREDIGRDGFANAAIVIYRLERPVAASHGKDARCDAPGKSP
ncbi:MAG: hypothetical protein ACXWAC_12085 [Usitatibacter sp.]